MAFNTSVTFPCSCGELLNTTFNAELFNYHQCNCMKCGTMYEVPRPSIVVRTNLSRSDEMWLFENGFSDKKVEMPQIDEIVLKKIHEDYLERVNEQENEIKECVNKIFVNVAVGVNQEELLQRLQQNVQKFMRPGR